MGFKVQPPTSRTEPSLNKTLRLKETMINEIQDLADEKDVSFNYLVAQMLQYCLDNLEKDQKNRILMFSYLTETLRPDFCYPFKRLVLFYVKHKAKPYAGINIATSIIVTVAVANWSARTRPKEATTTKDSMVVIS